MRKKSAAIFSCAVMLCGALSLSACSSSKLPAIPSGVKLNNVAQEEWVQVLDSFESKLAESTDTRLDYYCDYGYIDTFEFGDDILQGAKPTEIAQYVESTEVLYNLAALESDNNSYGDLNVSIYNENESRAHTISGEADPANFVVKSSMPCMIKLRNGVLTFVNNNAEAMADYENRETVRHKSNGLVRYIVNNNYSQEGGLSNYVLSGSALPDFAKDPFSHIKSRAEDYINKYEPEGDIYNLNGTQIIKDKVTFKVSIKADATRLFADVSFVYNGPADEGKGDYKRTLHMTMNYKLYLDVSAGLKENSFDSGALSGKDTENVLYFTADNDKFIADFQSGKEIVLSAKGGGSKENLEIASDITHALRVAYVYDNVLRYYSISESDFEFADGKLIISADAYANFKAYANNHFDESKLTALRISVNTIKYSYEKNGTKYYCETELTFNK